MGVQLSPLEFRYLMVFFSVSENLDVVHQVYDRSGGSSIHVPFKISYTAVCTLVRLNIILVGVQLGPLVCWQLLGPFSVSEKLDVVHQVYDRRGGLKYTCTLQN